MILSVDQGHIGLESHATFDGRRGRSRVALVQEPDPEERSLSSLGLSPLDLLLELVQRHGIPLGFLLDLDNLLEQGSEGLALSDVNQEKERS